MDPFAEKWIRVDKYPRYSISDRGRLRNEESGRITVGSLTSQGYRAIKIGKDSVRIHRLVAKAFLKNESGGNDVNHIDGNKQNNGVYNLEWCTRSHNVKHAHGFLPRRPIPTGDNHALTKVSDSDISEIKRRHSSGLVMQKDLASEYGVSRAFICLVVNGKKRAS